VVKLKFETLIPWIMPLLDVIMDEEESNQEGGG